MKVSGMTLKGLVLKKWYSLSEQEENLNSQKLKS